MYSVIDESHRIRREGYEALKLCKQNPENKELLQIKNNLCEILITCIKYMFNNECKNGPEKSSVFYTLNHLQSIKEVIFTIINVSGGAVNPFVKWLDVNEAFEESLKVGMIKNFGFIDITDFLIASREIVCQKVQELNESVKIYTHLDALFSLAKADRVIEENKSFITKTFSVFEFTNIIELYNKHVIEFLKKTIEDFQETDSGWTLKEINFITVHVQKYNPMRAGTFIQLPDFIADKKACVNIQNSDNFCFKWSILAAIKHQDILEKQKQGIPEKNIQNPCRVSQYKDCQYNLDFNDISFPTPPEEIQTFEKKNNISINLYIIKEFENGHNKIVLAQPSSIGKQERHINLLLLENRSQTEKSRSENSFNDLENVNITKKRKITVLQSHYTFHYVYIKSLSRLVGSQLSKNKLKKFFCDICFHYVATEEKLKEHEKKCSASNDCQIILPDPTDDEECCVEFKNFSHKLQVPFVIYSDFESVLKPVRDDVRKECQHEPVSVGYFLKCR